MKQLIEAPSDEDIERLARQLAQSEALIQKITGFDLSQGLDDLRLLQAVVDSGHLRIDQTYEWQSLGVVLGSVFVAEVEGLDWAMVEDEYGRDPALRFESTSILLFPLTMISKRIEQGEAVDVQALYDGVIEHVERIQREVGGQNPQSKLN